MFHRRNKKAVVQQPDEPEGAAYGPVASLAERFGITAWDGELPPTTVPPLAALIGQRSTAPADPAGPG